MQQTAAQSIRSCKKHPHLSVLMEVVTIKSKPELTLYVLAERCLYVCHTTNFKSSHYIYTDNHHSVNPALQVAFTELC